MSTAAGNAGNTGYIRRTGGAESGPGSVAPGAWDAELVPDEHGRTVRPTPECPVEVALAAVSGRWATLVLRELMQGPCSFGDLRGRLPDLTAKVLTDRLRDLEERGLVACVRLSGFPVRTRYELTGAGLALRPLLVELYRTGTAIREARDRARHPATEAADPLPANPARRSAPVHHADARDC